MKRMKETDLLRGWNSGRLHSYIFISSIIVLFSKQNELQSKNYPVVVGEANSFCKYLNVTESWSEIAWCSVLFSYVVFYIFPFSHLILGLIHLDLCCGRCTTSFST